MNIIINNQNIITNKQINRVLKLTKFKDLDNTKLIVLEKKADIFQAKRIIYYNHFLQTYNCEGVYNQFYDFTMVKLYNLEGNIEDKRLYGIGVLLHELKHRDDLMLNGNTNEISADKYAKKFLNNNSNVIKDILKLKSEWEIEDF
ncbi:hypothetical protein psyc5s11_28760 [Clostridium gelidum]|uniref:Phage metallopeptidase domain-containing protein n=1 Tax=Clostridium gelidum TaxID=704125 RepID=A0ABN6IXE3_9CLOT|nr:hypothetical protein [Clostridium gelidum]BCZ46809.1 hypothetical protein psyc5s11_28760 [Clostridium gelidum]